MKKIITLLILFISLIAYSQEERIKKKEQRGCLVSFAINVHTATDAKILKLYGIGVGFSYQSSKNFIIKPSENVGSFKNRIAESLIDYYETCDKMDVLILGHGDFQNNLLILNILKDHNKESLLYKTRLVFSSGCADASHSNQLYIWLRYAKTYIASRELNNALATAIFMKHWKAGKTADIATSKANNSYFGNRNRRDIRRGKQIKSKLFVYGDKELTITSSI